MPTTPEAIPTPKQVVERSVSEEHREHDPSFHDSDLPIESPPGLPRELLTGTPVIADPVSTDDEADDEHVRLQAAERAKQRRRPIQTTLDDMARTPQHDVRKLPNMQANRAKPDSAATYESLKLIHLGNKASDNWAKAMTLPEKKVNVYNILLHDLLTAAKKLHKDSAELTVTRRQIMTCLQGWGCPTERIKPKVDTENLIKILCAFVALR